MAHRTGLEIVFRRVSSAGVKHVLQRDGLQLIVQARQFLALPPHHSPLRLTPFEDGLTASVRDIGAKYSV
ncbi:MAG TPA: hypothetical protein VEV41_21070 [Terriglobales bacterium]|nr:hypothetical protein [Terriglobales bacterium]